MTRYNRHRVRPGQEHHLAGIRATSDGDCARCDQPVLKDQRIVSAGNGRWMHVGCHSGAGDA